MEMTLVKAQKPKTGYAALLERTYNDALVRGATKRAARAIIETFLENLAEDLTRYHGGRVAIPQFGVFTRRSRKARKIINPQTKAAMVLPASLTIGFRPARVLKKALETLP